LSLELVLIGFSTVEAIPLYHLYPGGVALRLLSKPMRSLNCEYDLDVCEWARGPEVFVSVSIPFTVVENLMSRWGCDIVFLDGLEPLEFFNVGYLRERLGPHVTLASRAHGFTDVRVEVDYYLVEDLSIIVGDEVIRRNVVRFVEGLQSKGKPFELHVYIDNPYVEELGDIVGVAESSGAPLHVTVQNPRGGGPVRSLYEQLRRRVGIVYVHTRIYDEVDTRCPRCDTILLYRSGWALRGVNLRDSTCPKCGTRIQITGVVRGKTRESLLRIARGGVVWYNPLFYRSLQAGRTHSP
jgi:hypothetical protein